MAVPRVSHGAVHNANSRVSRVSRHNTYLFQLPRRLRWGTVRSRDEAYSFFRGTVDYYSFILDPQP